MSKKIIAAMSGGVDSAVAAYLLKEEGFEVIGVTLRLAPDAPGEAVERTGRCCSIDDMLDARLVCDKIGIPFYAIDAQSKFKKSVFDPFVNAYKNGITPIPCLACNHEVKFGDLFATAKKLNAGLATGHYARLVEYQGQKSLAQPFDLERDQTYYLYGTDPEILNNLYFPLGEITKPKVREIAQKIGLSVHDKKDSHEICFVPDGNHARVVEKALGQKFHGNILDAAGKKIGEHDGVHKFTIGQRRGLGISALERIFVADIDAQSQNVVMAQKSALLCSKIAVSDFRALIPTSLWPKDVQVKIRARARPEKACLMPDDSSGQVAFEFEQSVSSVALGQAAVVYDGPVVLGGGIISGRLDGAFPRHLSLVPEAA